MVSTMDENHGRKFFARLDGRGREDFGGDCCLVGSRGGKPDALHPDMITIYLVKIGGDQFGLETENLRSERSNLFGERIDFGVCR